MASKNELGCILIGFVTLANTGIVHWWVRQSYKCVMMVQLWKLSLLPTGGHSAFRAESFAVLHSLEQFRKVTIVTDCQAGFNLFNALFTKSVHEDAYREQKHADVSMLIARHETEGTWRNR